MDGLLLFPGILTAEQTGKGDRYGIWEQA